MQEHTAATLENASERFWGELGQGEDELSSLKEVYDYWVNCAEDAYYENVMTDEYSFDFGEMINSQADFKIKLTALIDRFLEHARVFHFLHGHLINIAAEVVAQSGPVLQTE